MLIIDPESDKILDTMEDLFKQLGDRIDEAMARMPNPQPRKFIDFTDAHLDIDTDISLDDLEEQTDYLQMQWVCFIDDQEYVLWAEFEPRYIVSRNKFRYHEVDQIDGIKMLTWSASHPNFEVDYDEDVVYNLLEDAILQRIDHYWN